MKKFKLFFTILLACILALSFTACKLTRPNGGKNPEYVGGEIPDDNDVDILEPDDAEHDFVFLSQAGGTVTYKCTDCDKEATVIITCVSGTADAYTVDGNSITFGGITAKSVYGISGELYGNIVIDVTDSYKFELEMTGLTVYSYSECPISVLSGDKVTLSAKKSTQNYIYDMRGEVDSSDDTAVASSIYARCDLDIQGKGALGVKSVNNNGIHTKNDLSVKNLDLQVDCMYNALKGNDSVTIESGSIVLIARKGGGIKTSNSDVSSKGNQRGTVSVSGGDVLIYAACDGINAAYDVTVDQSTADVKLQIFTDKYSKYTVASASAYNARIAPAAGANGGMGGPGAPGGGMGGGNSDKGAYSTKGIKAANEVAISAGTVTVSAYDDAIHSNNEATLDSGSSPLGNVTVSGGKLTLSSNDDAIHADGNVNISGGSVNIVNSHEGIEGATVTISDGDIAIISSEDGINGTASSGTAITVSGGKLYVYAGGDGVDSNSRTPYEGINFAGGRCVIISTGRADSSIDTEQGYKFSGGYVIGIGQSGGMSSESANCSGFSSIGTSKTLNLTKGSYLVVSDVVTVKMPVDMSSFVVVLGNKSADISSTSSSSYESDESGVYWH